MKNTLPLPISLKPGQAWSSFFLLIFLLPAFISFSSTTASGAPCDQFVRKRKRIQKQRARLRKNVQQGREDIAGELESVFMELIELARKNRVNGQKEDLKNILRALDRLPYEGVDRLGKMLASLPDRSSNSSSDISSWEDQYQRKILRVMEPLRDLTNRAIKFQVNRFAFEFLQLILTIDPDNRNVRSALNQKKVEGRWLNPFAQQLARKGVFWHDRYGWVIKNELERYKNGHYFDIRGKQWGTREQLNKRHRSVNNPWVFRTEHLKLEANIDILKLVSLAKKLEDFYRKIFAVYSEFFSQGPGSYRLIFGLKQHPPLRIRIFRDKETFHEQVGDAPEWAAGLYKSRDRTSYFYGSNPSAMYHEFTHQIFDQFSPGGRGSSRPNWLEEGIASYSEAPEYNKYGDLTFGLNRKVKMHLRNRQQNKHVSVDELVSLKSFSDWNQAVKKYESKPGSPYAAAAALTHFCMETENRRYRSDFMDYLKTSYTGKPPCPLWNYMGLSKEQFIQKLDKWQS